MKNACQDLIQQKNSENRIKNLQNGVTFHKSIPSLLILDLTFELTGFSGAVANEKSSAAICYVAFRSFLFKSVHLSRSKIFRKLVKQCQACCVAEMTLIHVFIFQVETMLFDQTDRATTN
jgi:hypothetical protein